MLTFEFKFVIMFWTCSHSNTCVLVATPKCIALKNRCSINISNQIRHFYHKRCFQLRVHLHSNYRFLDVGWITTCLVYSSNCESWWLSFQESKSDFICKSYKRLEWRFFFHFEQALPMANLLWYPLFEHTIQSHCNACLFNIKKLCHTSLKYMCLHKTSVVLKPAYPTTK
jgi:hypothetical protein